MHCRRLRRVLDGAVSDWRSNLQSALHERDDLKNLREMADTEGAGSPKPRPAGQDKTMTAPKHSSSSSSNKKEKIRKEGEEEEEEEEDQGKDGCCEGDVGSIC